MLSRSERPRVIRSVVCLVIASCSMGWLIFTNREHTILLAVFAAIFCLGCLGIMAAIQER